MAEAILITGTPGAGKSQLCAGLRETLGSKLRVIEAHGLTTGADEAAAGPLRAVIAVADGANLERLLADAALAPLVRAHLAAADLVAVSRTDLVGEAEALKLARGLTGAPVVPAPHGVIDAEALPPRRGGALADLDLRGDWTQWDYAGGAALSVDQAEALLAERPAGVYRLSGIVRTGGAGLELELAGRMRQTRAVPEPQETVLQALGPRAAFRRAEMDALFSEKVASSLTAGGVYGYL